MTNEEMAILKRFFDEQGEQQAKGTRKALVLTPTRKKWLGEHNSPLADALPFRGYWHNNGYDAYVIWEYTKKIVSKMCGVSNTYHIEDEKKANRYADKILQTIYDLLTTDMQEVTS